MTLRELYQRVKGVDVEALKRDAVQENDKELVEINRQKQLYEKGINAEGVEIWDYRPYKPSTQKKKAGKGQPYDRVTLKDTGKFYKGMLLKVKGDEYDIDSTDETTRYLKDKYGDIFGIAPQFLTEAQRKVTRSFGRRFKKAVGL